MNKKKEQKEKEEAEKEEEEEKTWRKYFVKQKKTFFFLPKYGKLFSERQHVGSYFPRLFRTPFDPNEPHGGKKNQVFIYR